jgi:hypothetical protein
MIHSLRLHFFLLFSSVSPLYFVKSLKKGNKTRKKQQERKNLKSSRVFFFFNACHLNVRKNPIIDSYRQQHIVASLIANIIVIATREVIESQYIIISEC